MTDIANLAKLFDSALAGLQTISSADWQAGLQAAIADAQKKLPIEEDLLDAAKAILPQYAAIIDMYELYLALGGRPADTNALVFKRQGDDPYDTGY